jgi:hypothetical protein
VWWTHPAPLETQEEEEAVVVEEEEAVRIFLLDVLATSSLA